MPEFLDGWPVTAVFTFMFVLAMLRGQFLYWIGRIATEQTLKRARPTSGFFARAHAWLDAGAAEPGLRAIRRWGLIAVPLSYLTIGFQSMIQAAAGILRIELWKYAIAQIPGALAWAAIYTTFGFITWAIILSAARGNPWAAAALALFTAVLVAVLIMARRRRDTLPAAAPQATDPQVSETPND